MSGSLLLDSPADVADLAAFLGRAVRLDAGALVRLRGAGGAVRLWCQLPTDVLVTRAVRGSAPPDVTVAASALLAAADTTILTLPAARDAEWRGALPSPGHQQTLDAVPGEVIAQLLAAAERAFRQASGAADPRAVGDALLHQDVLTVTSGQTSAAVPLKGLLSLARMGFLGQSGSAEPMEVALVGNWLRLAAGYGDAYLRRGDRLGLFPTT